MFLPDNLKDGNQAAEEAERKRAYARIEQWAFELIPSDIRAGVQMSIQEVQCGDPDCSPIDVAVAIMFPRGGRGMVGLPMEAKNVLRSHLADSFPTQSVLLRWSNGEEADWPPLDDDEYEEPALPMLRFDIGTAVECRIGPDPVAGWTKGEVIQLWYREAGWPVNSYAPYKVQLADGKRIFAPADLDHIIRASQAETF